MRSTRTILGSTLLTILVLAAAACEPEAPVRERVENPELGLALATMPAGFVLESNDPGVIRLARASAEAPGTLTVEKGPEEPSGVNLVEAVNREQERVESLPEGQFFGQIEMGGPLGTAFSTRGRYLEEGQEVEVFRIFTLHPDGTHPVILTYRYRPGGDSKERLQHGMDVLGEIEPLSL
jgi:hypothetical protein